VSPVSHLRLIAPHDLQDYAGNHEGEQEEDDVEGYGHYIHEKSLIFWFIDLTE